MRVVVVGGAGAMGRWTVRDLTESEGVDEVVVADLDGSRACHLYTCPSPRVRG
jgi:prephenate dehydrogenase